MKARPPPAARSPSGIGHRLVVPSALVTISTPSPGVPAPLAVVCASPASPPMNRPTWVRPADTIGLAATGQPRSSVTCTATSVVVDCTAS